MFSIEAFSKGELNYRIGSKTDSGLTVTQLSYSESANSCDVRFDDGTHIRILNPDMVVFAYGPTGGAIVEEGAKDE